MVRQPKSRSTRPCETELSHISRAALRRQPFGAGFGGPGVEAIVYRAVVPVWVVRGERVVRRPVLCPINLSSPSKLGLASAVRMARLFEVPLRVMTVLSDNSSNEGRSVEEARRELDEMLAQHELNGIDVAVDGLTGSPAERNT